MTRRESGASWRLWLVAAAVLLSVAACGGTAASAGPGKATSTLPSFSPPAVPSGHAPPPGAVAASRSACTLISAADAAAALGTAVGQGQPVPPVNLHNGAVGGTCEWADSAGGTVLVITLKYPSSAIASKVFKNSESSAASAQPVRLPDLAPSEFGDTGTYGSTMIAQGFLLDRNRELNVTINEPMSGSGSRFSLSAFVTLVKQAAHAWR
jgi:hypothetical protein